MKATHKQVSLPRVRKVVLNNFSLYSRQSKISNDFPDGVFCLAGANGLGKSTYLIALNYGLTGIVYNPQKKFASVEEFYKANVGFSSDFFEGRVDEKDRDEAEVSLELQVGSTEFQLTRGVFEPETLRFLSIKNGEGKIEKFKDESESPGELHKIYCSRICKAAGFKNFEQLVFFQHFVLTFDERRHLLFWDSKVLERAIYLAFGGDYSQAHRADTLRRDIEKAGSYIRNATWQAAEVRDKIVDLEKTTKAVKSKSDDAKLKNMLERLEKRCADSETAVNELNNKLRDVTLQVADLSSRQSTLRSQYTEEFSKRSKSGSHLRLHPLIAASIREGHCHLCESETADTKRQIQAHLDGATCPICGAEIKRSDSKSNIDELKKIDKELGTVVEALSEANLKRNRLQNDFDAANKELLAAGREMEDFVDGNKKQLANLQLKSKTETGAILQEYRRQLSEILGKKESWRTESIKLKRDFYSLQKQLQEQYSRLEEKFVPLFKKLAQSFLGIDLDIKLEVALAEVRLVLEVKNSARREHHQLSESQRFFIDIALRMAFAQFISRPSESACLFIDTPEGSLDIAYETRAGQMFGHFIRSGCSILMTANINSSQLLLALAKECGEEKMKVCRMTSWTELSEVQYHEQPLFEQAYEKIETALKVKPKKK